MVLANNRFMLTDSVHPQKSLLLGFFPEANEGFVELKTTDHIQRKSTTAIDGLTEALGLDTEGPVLTSTVHYCLFDGTQMG